MRTTPKSRSGSDFESKTSGRSGVFRTMRAHLDLACRVPTSPTWNADAATSPWKNFLKGCKHRSNPQGDTTETRQGTARYERFHAQLKPSAMFRCARAATSQSKATPSVKLGLTQPFNFFPSKKRPFPVRNSIQQKTLKTRCIKQPLFGDTAEKSTAQRRSSGQRLLGKKRRHSTMSHRRHRKAPFVAENDGKPLPHALPLG